MEPGIFKPIGARSLEMYENTSGAMSVLLILDKQKRVNQVETCIKEWNSGQLSDARKVILSPDPGNDEILTFGRSVNMITDNYIYKKIFQERVKWHRGEPTSWRIWRASDEAVGMMRRVEEDMAVQERVMAENPEDFYAEEPMQLDAADPMEVDAEVQVQVPPPQAEAPPPPQAEAQPLVVQAQAEVQAEVQVEVPPPQAEAQAEVQPPPQAEVQPEECFFLTDCLIRCRSQTSELMKTLLFTETYANKYMMSAWNSTTKEALIYLNIDRIEKNILALHLENAGAEGVEIETFSSSTFEQDRQAAIASVRNCAKKPLFELVECGVLVKEWLKIQRHLPATIERGVRYTTPCHRGCPDDLLKLDSDLTEAILVSNPNSRGADMEIAYARGEMDDNIRAEEQRRTAEEQARAIEAAAEADAEQPRTPEEPARAAERDERADAAMRRMAQAEQDQRAAQAEAAAALQKNRTSEAEAAAAQQENRTAETLATPVEAAAMQPVEAAAMQPVEATALQPAQAEGRRRFRKEANVRTRKQQPGVPPRNLQSTNLTPGNQWPADAKRQSKKTQRLVDEILSQQSPPKRRESSVQPLSPRGPRRESGVMQSAARTLCNASAKAMTEKSLLWADVQLVIEDFQKVVEETQEVAGAVQEDLEEQNTEYTDMCAALKEQRAALDAELKKAAEARDASDQDVFDELVSLDGARKKAEAELKGATELKAAAAADREKAAELAAAAEADRKKAAELAAAAEADRKKAAKLKAAAKAKNQALDAALKKTEDLDVEFKGVAEANCKGLRAEIEKMAKTRKIIGRKAAEELKAAAVAADERRAFEGERRIFEDERRAFNEERQVAVVVAPPGDDGLINVANLEEEEDVDEDEDAIKSIDEMPLMAVTKAMLKSNVISVNNLKRACMLEVKQRNEERRNEAQVHNEVS